MSNRSRRRGVSFPKYFFGAFLYFIRIPMVLLTAILLLLIVVFGDGSIIDPKLLIKPMLGMMALSFLTFIFFFIYSKSVVCRLCRATFLRNLKCQKKPNVKKFMGSYTTPVAAAIFFKSEKIRCPYCGEKHYYFPKHNK